MPLAIVTDSTSSLSVEDAAALGIHVVPISVIIGARVYTEGVDVTADMISTALTEGVPVSTSRPSAETFEAVYRSLIASGVTDIVSVHLSSELSGTIDSARLAASRFSQPIHIVDTRQVGLATGFAAGRAARAVRRGESVEQVVAAARTNVSESSVLIYVDTLEYLRRGGRIGRAAAMFGSALAVKPILTVQDGIITPLEKVRTASRAQSRLVALATEVAQGLNGECDIGVQHLSSTDAARSVAERLAQALGRDEVPIDEVGASLGAHVGPGMIGVTISAR